MGGNDYVLISIIDLQNAIHLLFICQLTLIFILFFIFDYFPRFINFITHKFVPGYNDENIT